MKAAKYEWSCLIPASELSPSEREYLSLSDNNEWVAVDGTYSVEWDEEVALISIEDAYATHGVKYTKLSDGVALMFEYAVESTIDAAALEADKDGNLIDYAYDNHKDNYDR